jgi:hypothetical protein
LKSKERTSKTAPRSTDANGAEFVKVDVIFMKSKKLKVCKELWDARRDFIVEDKAENLLESFKVAKIPYHLRVYVKSQKGP